MCHQSILRSQFECQEDTREFHRVRQDQQTCLNEEENQDQGRGKKREERKTRKIFIETIRAKDTKGKFEQDKRKR